MSWDAWHSKLLESAWHVLHFVGHGADDTDTDEGVLAFVRAATAARTTYLRRMPLQICSMRPSPRRDPSC